MIVEKQNLSKNETSGLLTNLGLKLPIIKTPILGDILFRGY